MEFISSIDIPNNWKYLGTNNVDDGEKITSYGWVYQISQDVKMKVFYQPAPTERGGLVKKTPGEYNLLICNKKIDEINNYLNDFYK